MEDAIRLHYPCISPDCHIFYPKLNLNWFEISGIGDSCLVVKWNPGILHPLACKLSSILFLYIDRRDQVKALQILILILTASTSQLHIILYTTMVTEMNEQIGFMAPRH